MEKYYNTPWDGQCTIEMMQEFARVNDINLIAFHGNRKCVHQTADSDQWLTMFVWDEHGYFVKSSRPYVQTPLYTGAKSKVEMERDITFKNKEPEMWCGNVEPGVFFTENVNYVRQQWLEEGIVPRANVRGYNKYNSITRRAEGGDCTVKQYPAFYHPDYVQQLPNTLCLSKRVKECSQKFSIFRLQIVSDIQNLFLSLARYVMAYF